ncbi:MAG: diguanylate cyclase [Gemmatimonadetes bacterium]|nr:diguanylate cyclase [Gemmatimonadota bacterium]
MPGAVGPRLGATFVSSAAAYLQAVFLLAGAWELARRRALTPRAAVLSVCAAVTLAGVTTLAFVTLAGEQAEAMRHFLRVGCRALLAGLAYVVAAHGAWPPADEDAARGRRVLSGAFTLFGIQQLLAFFLAARSLAGAPAPGYAPFLGMADLVVQWVMGTAMILCLLEQEQSTALRAARQAEHLAYHDSLTGLPNRRLLLDRLSVALQHARRAGERVGVLFLDLDRFKVINDSLGHGAGDLLLQMVAGRVREAVRDGDTLARIGGDEFTLLLPGLKHGEGAGRVVQKLKEAMAQPFMVDGHELFVTASSGVALYPEDGEDAETLIRHADIAMYRAKEAGRDGFKFFAPAMNERARERLALEGALRKALALEQFRIHYQPLCEAATGRVTGVEALVRWMHPVRGLLPPAEFMELAESTGQVTLLGRWVLARACAQVRAWQRGGHPALTVSVNLSARQFADAGLVEEVRRVLEQEGLDPACLELEITESLAMHNVAATEATLRELKRLGVAISIDDFGTGYSSFGYLQRFPIDTLKIDREFVRDVDRDAGSADIAAAMIAMAHKLGLSVVAEGVERPEQLAFLREQSCDRAQGFLIGHPLPAHDVERLLRTAWAEPAVPPA